MAKEYNLVGRKMKGLLMPPTPRWQGKCIAWEVDHKGQPDHHEYTEGGDTDAHGFLYGIRHNKVAALSSFRDRKVIEKTDYVLKVAACFTDISPDTELHVYDWHPSNVGLCHYRTTFSDPTRLEFLGLDRFGQRNYDSAYKLYALTEDGMRHFIRFFNDDQRKEAISAGKELAKQLYAAAVDGDGLCQGECGSADACDWHSRGSKAEDKYEYKWCKGLSPVNRTIRSTRPDNVLPNELGIMIGDIPFSWKPFTEREAEERGPVRAFARNPFVTHDMVRTSFFDLYNGTPSAYLFGTSRTKLTAILTATTHEDSRFIQQVADAFVHHQFDNNAKLVIVNPDGNAFQTPFHPLVDLEDHLYDLPLQVKQWEFVGRA